MVVDVKAKKRKTKGVETATVKIESMIVEGSGFHSVLDRCLNENGCRSEVDIQTIRVVK